MKIAISGKGGVGKTTLAAVLARAMAEEGRKVFAIDADPNINLALSLGFPEDLTKDLVPLMEMKGLIEERTGAKPGSFGSFFKLNPRVDDIPDAYSCELHGVRLLITGAMKDARGGCYCPENTLLRGLLRHLFVDRSEVIILDMEAGIEHLTRGTCEAVDVMIVVVEPGLRSIKAAEAIERLSLRMGIDPVLYVANKVRGDEDRDFIVSHLPGKEIIGFLPLDPKVAEADAKGVSPYDTAPRLVEEIQGTVGILRERVKPATRDYDRDVHHRKDHEHPHGNSHVALK